MAQEYLNLEETAAMLKLTPGEVNRMREQSQIRAFRDGSNWKFRKEDVENLFTKMIKERNAANRDDREDTDVNDLLGFGLEEENDELPTMMADTGFIDPDSGLVLQDEDSLDDDVLALEDRPSLLEESSVLSLTKSSAEQSDGLGLSLEGDVDAGGGIDLAGEVSPMLEEEDDDLVLGSSSDLSLSGDSGISLVENNDGLSLSGDSGISLLGDENADDGEELPTLMVDGVAVVDDDDTEHEFGDTFDLIAEEDGDDPDSSSQVISIDGDDGFGGFDSVDSGSFASTDLDGDDFAPAPATDDFASVGAAGGDGSFGGGIDLTSPVAQPVAAIAVSQADYPGWSIALMFVCAMFLALGGMFMLDLLRNMWSWNQPVIITSPIMEAIAGAIGWR